MRLLFAAPALRPVALVGWRPPPRARAPVGPAATPSCLGGRAPTGRAPTGGGAPPARPPAPCLDDMSTPPSARVRVRVEPATGRGQRQLESRSRYSLLTGLGPPGPGYATSAAGQGAGGLRVCGSARASTPRSGRAGSDSALGSHWGRARVLGAPTIAAVGAGQAWPRCLVNPVGWEYGGGTPGGLAGFAP